MPYLVRQRIGVSCKPEIPERLVKSSAPTYGPAFCAKVNQWRNRQRFNRAAGSSGNRPRPGAAWGIASSRRSAHDGRGPPGLSGLSATAQRLPAQGARAARDAADALALSGL